MKRADYKYRPGVRVSATILGLFLFAAACSPGGYTAVTHLSTKVQAPAVENAGAGVHYTVQPTAEQSKTVGGLLELYLDPTSLAPIIRETSNNTYWTSLGTDATEKAAAAVTAVVSIGGKRITLNSQDHAIAFGNATQTAYDKDGGKGISVSYTLAPNAETAERKTAQSADVLFKVTCDYYLKDGNFYAAARWSNESHNSDAFIESISLLDRFGTLTNPTDQDYLLIPDGSGTLVYPAKAVQGDTAALQTLSFAVYGEDPSAPAAKEDSVLSAVDANGKPAAEGTALTASLGYFGIKRGTGTAASGFLAIIEEGAAIADIIVRQDIPSANPQIAKQSAVGARFRVTPAGTDSSGVPVRAEKSYDGELRLCYRFFFGENANYSQMAAACREQLLRQGLLSPVKSVTNDDRTLPLNLTILGTMPTDKNGQTTLTTFDQTQGILGRLKGKGVDSANIRYLGALTGGMQQSETRSIAPLGKIGGSAALTELQDYCAGKNYDLFIDTNLLPVREGSRSQAITLAGNPLSTTAVANTLANVAGNSSNASNMPVRQVSTIGDSVKDVLDKIGALNVPGISIGDLGSTLYSDYAAGGTDRVAAAAQLADYFPSLSAKWRVMLDTGLFHVVRAADVIVNLPDSPQLTMDKAYYRSIPFLQMLLHGSADYSGTPANLNGGHKEALLKAIEYGACVSYTWSASADGDERIYFENTLPDAASDFAEATKVLGDLREVQITKHDGMVNGMQGVSLTTYANGAKVYVNYNSAARTVGQVVIPAESAVRG
ncbi:MAG: DUF5696 domain-containing protein [Oscillospiraceae bacterium]|jgi:hypothetical protein|nr:DUF5696 domain-containing protein [Oscillospiraceae bacterium]